MAGQASLKYLVTPPALEWCKLGIISLILLNR